MHWVCVCLGRGSRRVCRVLLKRSNAPGLVRFDRVQLLFRGLELLFRGFELLFRGLELLFRGLELLFNSLEFLLPNAVCIRMSASSNFLTARK
jgi:hypothetical protein